MASASLASEEAERLARMAANRAKMEQMGMLKQATILQSFAQVKNAPALGVADKKIMKAPLARKPPRHRVRAEPRRSARISGAEVNYMEIDEHDRPVGKVHVKKESKEVSSLSEDELVDLMDREGHYNACGHLIAPPKPSEEAWQAIQEVRCNSQGRGSVYDSHAGITCHFCRQKKLCGEEGCPRCSSRDSSKECIGKTQCTRCAGATGQFCRACLLIRYGQRLEDAREEMAAGEWLCPHCYEEEHPDAGWICNSSICMKRRGLRPTGIAIFDAQQRGFKSVAHLLQDQLRKRGVSKVLGGEESSEEQPGSSSQQAGSSGSQQASDTQVQGGNTSSSGEDSDTDVPLAQRAAKLAAARGTSERKAAAGDEKATQPAAEPAKPASPTPRKAAAGAKPATQPTRRSTRLA